MGCVIQQALQMVLKGTENRDSPKDTSNRGLGPIEMLPDALSDITCKDCRVLWEEYTAAITEHIRNEHLLLMTLQNGGDIESIEAEADKANSHRERLREAIRTHQEYAHRGPSAPISIRWSFHLPVPET